MPNILAVLTPPTSTLLVKVEQARVRCNLDPGDNSQDDFLNDLIAAASSWFESAIGRPLALQTITEGFPGVDRLRLVLGMRPLVSVSAIRYEGGALDASDYRIDDRGAGMLYRDAGWFGGNARAGYGISQNSRLERGAPLLEADYRAGWFLPTMSGTPSANEERLPMRIQQAALTLIQGWYLQRDRDPFASSARVGDVSGSWLDAEAPKSVQAVADAFSDPLGSY